MANITKISTLIPVGNGLDTIDPALQQDAGTLLVADNIIQERDGEWRRRNGFTNVSTDNVSSTGTIWSPANGSVAPFQVATNGAGGMVAADYKNLFFYSPATASWQPSTSGTFYTTAEDAYDVALARAAWSDRRLNAFATDGSLAIVSKDILAGASVAAGASGSIVDMASGAVLTEYFLFSVASAIAVRCAILGQYFCWFFVDSSGNLFAYVWNKATSNTGSFINLKTGCQTGATVALDAMYYTGTSITVVVKIAAGGFQFIEFTPSAGTKATDVLVGAPTPSTCLTLIPEPSGSGTRLVGISSAAPQTQVMRFSISGGLSSNDAIEAIQASNMTGCASNSGADFAVVYQNNATKALRRNTKIAGVVGTPTTIPQGVTSSIQPYIESHGWGIAGDDRWFFVMGQCQPSTTDPQNTYVVWCDSFQSSNLGAPSSAVLPLQGHGPVYTGDMGGVSQISKISTRKFAAGLEVGPLPEASIRAGVGLRYRWGHSDDPELHRPRDSESRSTCIPQWGADPAGKAASAANTGDGIFLHEPDADRTDVAADAARDHPCRRRLPYCTRDVSVVPRHRIREPVWRRVALAAECSCVGHAHRRQSAGDYGYGSMEYRG